MRTGSHDVLAVHDRGQDRLGVAWLLPDDAAPELLAVALDALDHPAIARSLGITEVDGRAALLTEPLPPRTLRDQVEEQGALPESAALQLGLRLAEALAAVHDAGLVHGSLSPDAVHVEGPEVVLADFRRARFDPDPRPDLAGLAEVLEFAAGVPSEALREVCARCRGEGDALCSVRAVSGALLAAADALAPGDTWPSMPPQVRTTPVPLPAEREGDMVGAYVLQKLLGEGSMGRVFAARHLRLGRHVALKLLRSEHAASNPIVQRFFQEARTVNEIDHEHIVQIFDFVEERLPDGSPRAYCVMELLEGQSLSELIRRGPLPMDRIATIGAQLCRALAAAHRVGVVHRDVKPDNIFVTEREGNDFVKVVDFGIAKLARPMGDLVTGTTVHGAIIGTPSYMSPEQAAGLEVDHRADLHAVGVVLYELLTGKVPYDAPRFGALAAQIISQPHPPLPSTTAGGERIPRGLVKLVEQLLAKDPRSRPGSAEAVERAFIQAMAPEPARRRTIRKALALGGAVAIGAGMLLLVSRRPAVPRAPVAVAAAPGPLRPPAPIAPAPPATAAASVAPEPEPLPRASAPRAELTAFPDPIEIKSEPRVHEESPARHARRSRRVILDPFAE